MPQAMAPAPQAIPQPAAYAPPQPQQAYPQPQAYAAPAPNVAAAPQGMPLPGAPTHLPPAPLDPAQMAQALLPPTDEAPRSKRGRKAKAPKPAASGEPSKMQEFLGLPSWAKRK